MSCRICGRKECMDLLHGNEVEKIGIIADVLETELPWLREDLLKLAQKIYDELGGTNDR